MDVYFKNFQNENKKIRLTEIEQRGNCLFLIDIHTMKKCEVYFFTKK